MINRQIFRIVGKFSLLIGLATSGMFLFNLLVAAPQALACTSHTDYLSGSTYCGSGHNVDAGRFDANDSPKAAGGSSKTLKTAKATFISDVENSPAEAFYVDLMIGKAANKSGGHDAPTAADITDFENRVNSPDVGIKLANSSTLGLDCSGSLGDNNSMKPD